MASSMAYALCVVLCICSMQTVVMAGKRQTIDLTLYAHWVRGGPNSTVLPAAGTGTGQDSATPLGWGSFLVLDNFLREGPSTDSKLLGKVTGTGTFTTIGDTTTGGSQVVIKFWYGVNSNYNGSSFTIIGTLSYGPSPWEVTVVAGTGHFRGYTGYGLAALELSTTVDPVYVYKWNFYLHD